MSQVTPKDFSALYASFQAPIAVLDCGAKCAPFNQRGVPFCCDIHHAIPTAYNEEWAYLKENTNLWHLWQGDGSRRSASLLENVPDGQNAIQCLGHHLCQRNFRSIACRSFPFFPYITRENEFIGLSYYWEYEDRCWVISHLSSVTSDYLSEFFNTYDQLFNLYPEERVSFHHFSTTMRRHFGRIKRAIPLLHRNGKCYKVTPRNGRMRRIDVRSLPIYGRYLIAERLPFPGE